MSITDSSTANSSRTSSPGSELRSRTPKMKSATPAMPPSNTLIISPAPGMTTVFFEPVLQRRLEEIFRNRFAIIFWNFSQYFETLNIVFENIKDAEDVKEALTGQDIFTILSGELFAEYRTPCPVAISFGLPTHSDAQYLALPKLEKQFKLSPPPSPPAGYVQGIEDAPNKVVHAEDYEFHSQELHTALQRAMSLKEDHSQQDAIEPLATRGRSQSLAVVYHPEHYGSNPSLPSISVEDTDFDSPTLTNGEQEIMAHTARPPVELMEH